MKVTAYKQNGEKVSDINLSDSFNITVSSKAVTLYINYLRSALRSPVANTKDRGEVSGGGRKPWKQKGTGNARVGSSRSPLWVGGGVTFGPSSDQNFKTRINSKEKKRVIRGLIAELIKDKKLIAIDDLASDRMKTKDASSILSNLKSEGKVSVILNKDNGDAYLGFRNIAGVKVMNPKRLDIIYLLSSDKAIISKSALKEVEETYSLEKTKAEEAKNE